MTPLLTAVLFLAAEPAPVPGPTLDYWQDGGKINAQFAKGYKEIRFPNLFTGKVAALAENTAKQLRELSKEGVDKDVIDHVNEVIRYYEALALKAHREGNRELAKQAVKAALDNIDKLRPADGQPAPPPSADVVGSVLKLITNDDAAKEARRLKDAEAALIKAMRKKYQIELEPW